MENSKSIEPFKKKKVKSNQSLAILNEFMELLILLDQIYAAPEQQK